MKSGSILSRHSNAIATQIARIGEQVWLTRQATDGLNKYNKPADENFNRVGDEKIPALLVRPSSDDKSSTARTQTGFVDRDTPAMFFPSYVDAQTNDRVEYLGTTYEINNPTEYPTHSEAEIRKVQKDDEDVIDGSY